MTDDPQRRARGHLISRESLLRLTGDILAETVASSRGGSPAFLDRAAWSDMTRVRDGGLDLDSLELLSVSAALSEFFHLHEYGAEDYLLQLPTVGDWCDLIAQSLLATGTDLTFRTSGSTGEPKRCTHAVVDLMTEVDAWTNILGPFDGVVSLVPSHHIYGAIFSVLLPERLGVSCVGSGFGGAKSVSQAAPGTLVVGTPTTWAYVARALPMLPPGLIGVSSTAPMPSGLAGALRGAGLQRLVEIYGSTETGGIGYRDDPTGAFTLLAHWRADRDHVRRHAPAEEAGVRHPLMDQVEWTGDRRFILRGRHDGAVQVGGYNVFPERIRERLLGHADVAQAAVRFDAATGRLKAFVVPVSGADDETFVARVEAWCAETMTVAERPRQFGAGPALPRNALGKLTDW